MYVLMMSATGAFIAFVFIIYQGSSSNPRFVSVLTNFEVVCVSLSSQRETILWQEWILAERERGLPDVIYRY